MDLAGYTCMPYKVVLLTYRYRHATLSGALAAVPDVPENRKVCDRHRHEGVKSSITSGLPASACVFGASYTRSDEGCRFGIQQHLQLMCCTRCENHAHAGIASLYLVSLFSSSSCHGHSLDASLLFSYQSAVVAPVLQRQTRRAFLFIAYLVRAGLVSGLGRSC